MVLSKREKYILAIAVTVVTIFVADRYIITPFLALRAQVKAEKQSLIDKMEYATSLFKRRKLLGQKWQNMISGGLENDVSKTESKVLNAIRSWSQECGLMLSSVKPDRVVGEGNLQEITFQVAGTGTMSSVSRFLWRIETARLPFKIKDIQLGSRDEEADDMSLQLRLSAIYLSTEVQDSEVQSEQYLSGVSTQ